MHRLKNAFSRERAAVIFGGPSIIENKLDLSRLDSKNYVVFLECKALTPQFLTFGLEPDFFLMSYPEKCKSNSLQNVIFQSFLAEYSIDHLIRDRFRQELDFMRSNFNDYFESWKLHRGPHKRYRWKPDVYLPNSPFGLLSRLKDAAAITYVHSFNHYVTRWLFDNPVYLYDHVDALEIGALGPAGPSSTAEAKEPFVLDDYYHPTVKDGMLKVKDYRFTNSAAIAFFPLLNYMGFKTVYCLGLDMSMLGSMEYAAPYTFKSMRHYGKFFKKAAPVFNASFQRNPKRFMRPPAELESLRSALSYAAMEFVNVFEPFEYALPIEGIRTIGYSEFWNE